VIDSAADRRMAHVRTFQVGKHGLEAAGVINGVPYLATEHVLGTDIATLIRYQGPLPVEQAISYTLQAARGLVQLHLHGVIHRNIKPHILLIDTQGRLKVTTFFLAKLDDRDASAGPQEELTQMGQLMGTAEYLAPKQAADASSSDHRADIYSLGCTLHLLLTGRPPYAGESVLEKIARHRTAPLPSLRRGRRDVPAALDRTFQKMPAKNPAPRQRFMGDVVAQLAPKSQRPAWLRYWWPWGD
jgi:serine/threonine protein kinase